MQLDGDRITQSYSCIITDYYR